MNPSRSIAFAVLLGTMALLPACGADRHDAEAERKDTSVISRAVNEAIVEAREEIRSGNMTISESESGLPKAEITPKGDLLIGGKAVAIDEKQRALLLEYRGHIVAVAESGMQIGMQGADLATKAMGEAFKGLVTGKSEAEIEKSVEAEAAKIKVSAAKLCARLPGMMLSQQKAAAAIPEFKPYATMTQQDVDDCLKDTDEKTVARNAAQEAAAAAKDAGSN